MKRRYLVLVGLAVVVGAVGAKLLASRFDQPKTEAVLNTPAARNEARQVGLNNLKAALAGYLVAHDKLPVALPAVPTEICAGSASSCRMTKLVDLNFLVGTYLASVPSDPMGGAGHYTSGFQIFREKSGAIHVIAERAEGQSLSLTF
ncbi:MAG TPA: hypothetical protein VI322_00895 [Candidatus Saccharimonadia bacterium]